MYASAGARDGEREPHRERILALSQRLESLQSSLELESHRRTEALETKLRNAEERIARASEAESTVAREVQTEVYGIERLISEEKEEREACLTRYVGGLKTLQDSVLRELREVSIGRKEARITCARCLTRRRRD